MSPGKAIFQGPLFKRWLLQQKVSDSTVRHYMRACGRWITYLRHMDASAPVAWLQWAAPSGEKRLTGFAVRKYQQFAEEVFGDASTYGVPRQLPPCSRPDPHPIPRGDIRKMRVAAKSCFSDPHNSFVLRIFITLVDELALRRTEAFFAWTDVDFDKGEILVHGKGGDRRRLPLSHRLLRLLKWLRVRSSSNPWTSPHGRPLKPDSMYRRFKRVARIIGRPDSRLHWLRHGRLTALAATPGGFDPLNICAISGHRQIGSLRHYCEPQMTRLRELMQQSLAATMREQ